MDEPAAAADLARDMFRECVRDGQSARSVVDDGRADAVRAGLRRIARDEGVRIRTARLGDAVVVARTDAAIWHDDTATMRAKLTPTA